MGGKKQHIIDIVFVLALFCVFVVLALFVVVLGADVYKGISQKMDDNYDVRTSLSYITEKIRQSDGENEVKLGNINGKDAIVLSKTINTKTYETWIFEGEGQLREITVKAGYNVKEGDGQPIIPLNSATFNKNGDSLLEISVENTLGVTSSTYVGVKCGQIGEVN